MDGPSRRSDQSVFSAVGSRFFNDQPDELLGLKVRLDPVGDGQKAGGQWTTADHGIAGIRPDRGNKVAGEFQIVNQTAVGIAALTAATPIANRFATMKRPTGCEWGVGRFNGWNYLLASSPPFFFLAGKALAQAALSSSDIAAFSVLSSLPSLLVSTWLSPETDGICRS